MSASQLHPAVLASALARTRDLGTCAASARTALAGLRFKLDASDPRQAGVDRDATLEWRMAVLEGSAAVLRVRPQPLAQGQRIAVLGTSRACRFAARLLSRRHQVLGFFDNRSATP